MAEKAEYEYLDVLRNCSPTNADVQQAGISNIRLYARNGLIQLETVFAGSVREIPARVCWTAVSLMNPMMCAL